MTARTPDPWEELRRLAETQKAAWWDLDHERPNFVRLSDGSGQHIATGYGPDWTARAIVEFAHGVAGLLAERDRLREALSDLLEDTEHIDHDCGDADCPVAVGRAALDALDTGEARRGE